MNRGHTVSDDKSIPELSNMSQDDKESPRGDDESPRIISLIDEDIAGANRDDAEYLDAKSGPLTSQAKANQPSSPYRNTTAFPASMNLDLSQFSRADGKGGRGADSGSKGDDSMSEPSIQEKSVLVVFELPDGSQGEKTFKYGHTVELLKSFVEEEYGIPMLEQALYLDDRKLENPFSLLDYPEVKGMFSVTPKHSSTAITSFAI